MIIYQLTGIQEDEERKKQEVEERQVLSSEPCNHNEGSEVLGSQASSHSPCRQEDESFLLFLRCLQCLGPPVAVTICAGPVCGLLEGGFQSCCIEVMCWIKEISQSVAWQLGRRVGRRIFSPGQPPPGLGEVRKSVFNFIGWHAGGIP